MVSALSNAIFRVKYCKIFGSSAIIVFKRNNNAFFIANSAQNAEIAS